MGVPPTTSLIKREAGLSRIPYLDGLRGLACLFVVAHHYFLMPFYDNKDVMQSWWGRLFFQTWGVVDWFFVLSGWLIGTILLQHRDSPRYYRTFYVRRAARVLPLFFVLSVLFLFLSKTYETHLPWLFNDPLMPLWSFPLTLHTLVGGYYGTLGDRFISVSWTLVLEMHFYLLIPVIIKYFNRFQFALLFLGLTALAIYLRLVVPGECGVWQRSLLFTRPEGVFGGVLLAYYQKDKLFLFNGNPWGPWILWIALFPGVVLSAWDYYFGVFTYTWFALTAMAFFAVLLVKPMFFKDVLEFKFFRWVGTISYSVYIWHLPIIGLVFNVFLKGDPQPSHPFFWEGTLGALILSFLVAQLSYVFIEKPFLKAGKRFSY
ncbi:MAG: acyltransferase [Flavobacteriales bacterium]|nr:acyltransferase [Flavobacteriales bacterium]MCX7768931.1 acyltransferase [Flavobacteriales bacterium]MDW8409972.1 acyltransferase [Flavobacteriales bacterium]